MSILLASKSPRRRELMALITPFFEVCDAHFDESAISAPTPAALAEALATGKAQAVLAARTGDVRGAAGVGNITAGDIHLDDNPKRSSGFCANSGLGRQSGDVGQGCDTIIGCDTVVELAGRALGKPANPGEAVAMLTALAGRRHFVHTGVCILVPGQAPHRFVESTAVDFSTIPPDAIRAYAATPEPYDKAGGYGIQGWAARFIPRIEGCYYNVMGLPVASLYQALAALGLL